MGKFTKEDIVARAKELAVMISETEEVDFFKRAEAQINESQTVKTHIEQIKSLKKQAVNLEHWGKKENLKKVEKELWLQFFYFQCLTKIKSICANVQQKKLKIFF